MKNTKIFAFILIITMAVSCNSFLDEEAYDIYTTENFPRTASDAEALVNEIYTLMGESLGGRLIFMSELPSEMATTRRSGDDQRARLDEFRTNNNAGYMAEFWSDSYVAIKQANAVIALYEGETAIDPALASRLVAEAKVLRAYSYFLLSNFFGDVPLILKRIGSLEETANPISPLSKVYNAIIQDLLDAEPNLPFTAIGGRVTRNAARALLGKVYIQRAADPWPEAGGSNADYTEALKWLRLVKENDGGTSFSLESKFANLFALENIQSSKSSNEIVFQLWRSAADCCDNAIKEHLVPQDADAKIWGGLRWGNVVAEVPFYLSYESTDERFYVTFMDTISGSTPETTLYYNVNAQANDNFRHEGVPFTKWMDNTSPDGAGSNNIFIIRYADVLLMIAEAENEVNNGPTAEAYNAVNQVRARARTVSGNMPPYDGLNYNQFREVVYNERRWEFAQEGHGLRDGQRFFDIFKQRVEAAPNYKVSDPIGTANGGRIRDAAPDMPINVTIENIRFPIPVNEIDTNPVID